MYRLLDFTIKTYNFHKKPHLIDSIEYTDYNNNNHVTVYLACLEIHRPYITLNMK